MSGLSDWLPRYWLPDWLPRYWLPDWLPRYRLLRYGASVMVVGPPTERSLVAASLLKVRSASLLGGVRPLVRVMLLGRNNWPQENLPVPLPTLPSPAEWVIYYGETAIKRQRSWPRRGWSVRGLLKGLVAVGGGVGASASNVHVTDLYVASLHADMERVPRWQRSRRRFTLLLLRSSVASAGRLRVRVLHLAREAT